MRCKGIVMKMKAYLSVFRIRYINSLQYRAVLVGEILSRFVWGFMEMLAFQALYSMEGARFALSLSQTVSYCWLQQTLLVLFAVVFGDSEIYDAIGTGSISYELVRPTGLYGRWFCQSAGNRLAFVSLTCIPVLAAALLLPSPYGLMLPEGPLTLLLFFGSTALALGVVVAFAMLMYISLFYTLSHRGVKIMVTAVVTFFSGGVIPLPFFPPEILAVVQYLPFAAMQNMPLQIYTGGITGAQALWGMGFQLLWLGILVLAGQLWMKHTLRRVTVQGG